MSARSLCLLAFASSMLAVTARANSEASPSEVAPSAPVSEGVGWLSVTRDDVNLRNRPDRNSRVVARLPREFVLRQLADLGDWHRVAPPKGTFSYVGADFIDVRPNGEAVVSVNRGNLRVRVGSLVIERDPLREEVQRLLSRGSQVRLLERGARWHKIAPPEGVAFFIHSSMVESIAADAVEAAREAAPELEVPWGKDAARAIVTAPTTDWAQRLRDLEQRIAAQRRAALAEQRWTAILAELRGIAGQADDPTAATSAQRWLERLTPLAESVQRLRGTQTAAAVDADQPVGASTPNAFVARGIVRRSMVSVVQGGAQLWTLIDPETGRVAAYLQPAQTRASAADASATPARDLVNLDAHVGRYVGVRGRAAPSSELGTTLIHVSQVEALGG